MPDSYINPTGNISIGSTSGSGQSLGILRQYRTGISANTTVTIGQMATFFKTFSQNTSLGANPTLMSQFRGGIVFRIFVETLVDYSDSTYHTATDGKLGLRVYGGSGGNFRLESTSAGWPSDITIGNGGLASWTTLGGGGSTSRAYVLKIKDVNTSVEILLDITMWEAGDGDSVITYQSTNYDQGDTFWNKN